VRAWGGDAVGGWRLACRVVCCALCCVAYTWMLQVAVPSLLSGYRRYWGYTAGQGPRFKTQQAHNLKHEVVFLLLVYFIVQILLFVILRGHDQILLLPTVCGGRS
jgi:hypothetical protein